MNHPDAQHRSAESSTVESVEDAARDRPEWITDELIALTVRTWQPFYAVCLTVEDAADIILNASRLMSSIKRANERPSVQAAGV